MTTVPQPLTVGARYQAIIDWLSAEGRLEVVEVANRLGVAQETIRRDLRTLESEGKLQRVHGGAVSVDVGPLPANHAITTDPATLELATRAWRQLPRAGTILLGTGRLALTLAQTIVSSPPDERGLTVVTNSLDAAVVLARASRVAVYNIGGTVSTLTRAQEGNWALHELERLHVDVSVVCPAGVSVERGFTQATPAAAAVSQVEVATGQRVIALASAATLGVNSFVRFATLTEVDEILVAGTPAQATIQPFLDRGVSLGLAEPLP
jgi:DeoR family fructose operon transcriptional repressor